MEATTATKKLVEYRVKNGVAWLELTNPPMNSYTFEMMHDLDEAMRHIEAHTVGSFGLKRVKAKPRWWLGERS